MKDICFTIDLVKYLNCEVVTSTASFTKGFKESAIALYGDINEPNSNQ